MTYQYTPDFTAMTEISETFILGVEWVIPLVLGVLIMAFITRDINKWRTLAFPVFALLRIMGLPVSLILLIVTGIFFVVEVLSLGKLGNILSPIKSYKPKEELKETKKLCGQVLKKKARTQYEQGLKKRELKFSKSFRKGYKEGVKELEERKDRKLAKFFRRI